MNIIKIKNRINKVNKCLYECDRKNMLIAKKKLEKQIVDIISDIAKMCIPVKKDLEKFSKKFNCDYINVELSKTFDGTTFSVYNNAYNDEEVYISTQIPIYLNSELNLLNSSAQIHLDKYSTVKMQLFKKNIYNTVEIDFGYCIYAAWWWYKLKITYSKNKLNIYKSRNLSKCLNLDDIKYVEFLALHIAMKTLPVFKEKILRIKKKWKL